MPYLLKVLSVAEKHFQLPKQLSFAVAEMPVSGPNPRYSVAALRVSHENTTQEIKSKVGERVFFLRL